MKKIISIVLTALVLLALSVTASAAPPEVGSDEVGTVSDLFVVRKPETPVSSTTKKSYVLSAVSREGVEIALYTYDAENGNYKYIEDSEKTVGLSGLYIKRLELAGGNNYILVRARQGENVQIARLDVKVVNQSLLDFIKFSSPMFGW